MKTITPLLLVQEEGADPVLLRLKDDELQVCNCTRQGEFGPQDDDQWQEVDYDYVNTRAELKDAKEVIKLLGGKYMQVIPTHVIKRCK